MPHTHALTIRDTYYKSTASTTHDHPTAYPDSHTHPGTDTIAYGVAVPLARALALGLAERVQRERAGEAEVSAGPRGSRAEFLGVHREQHDTASDSGFDALVARLGDDEDC